MTKIQFTENGNDIYCHPINTVESLFFELPSKTRIDLKNQLARNQG